MPSVPENVLVIGGAGYIGSHCVRQLRLAGHRPVVLDNLVFGHRAALPADVPLVVGDLGDEALVTDLLKRENISIVMHFAAYAFVGESVTDPLKYYDNNLARPIALLRAMRAAGVTKFIFSSTCATYGEPEKLPMTEDTPQKPINPYGQTKLDLENVLKACARAHGLSFAAFRYFNAAGAAEDGSIGEDHIPETHLIPLAIAAAQGLRPQLTVFGTDYPTPDGTCLRDYVHVDDLSRAHIAVFPKLQQPGTQLFYNLGTGRPFSVKEIIGAVEQVTGLKVPLTYGDRRAGDPPALYADAAKARAELGWVPKYQTPLDIIRTAWAWHQSHPKGYAEATEVSPALSREQMALAEAMSNISEDAYCASWMQGLEYELWEILMTKKTEYGRSLLSGLEKEQLRLLAQKCGGWIIYGENGETFVPMGKWEKMFAEHRKARD